MRTRILAALLAVQTLVPVSAFAQRGGPPAGGPKGGGAPSGAGAPTARPPTGGAPSSKPGSGAAMPLPGDEMLEQSTEPGETEGAEVVDQPEGDRIRTEPEKQSGEVHTVVGGDTLWDLSQRYLGSPWYWPKVWSYNPEIANPHWIYPGNQVRFFPTGEEVPTEVEVGAGPAEEGATGEDVEAGEMVAEEPAEEIQIAGKLHYTPKAAQRFTQVGFVTPKELDESGKIDSSFAESEMLSFPDKAYVSFKNKTDAKVGDRYVIFKSVAEVKHPGSGDRFGYMTKFLGTVKVLKVSDKLATAQVEDTWDDVHRGDLVGPFGEQLSRTVAVRVNDREVAGTVVVAMEPDLTLMGEHHMVVIDRGSSDGVMPGNTFTVLRQYDGLGTFMDPTVRDNRYPVEDVATCMAIDVKDKATTCILIRSMREIVVGDRVLMRPNTSAISIR